MTKRQISQIHSSGGQSRRSMLQSAAVLLSAPFVAKATGAWAQEKLAGSGEVVVFSYGGSFTEGIRRYVYEPFTKATGIKVVDVVADLAEPQSKRCTRQAESIGTLPTLSCRTIRQCMKLECLCQLTTLFEIRSRSKERLSTHVSTTQLSFSRRRGSSFTTRGFSRAVAHKTGRTFGT